MVLIALITFLPPASEVCEGYVFTGVCLSTGGLSRSLSGEGVLVRGGSLSGGVSGPEGVSVRERPPAERDPPTVNERAVRILLGCILLIMKNLGEWISIQVSWFWIYSPRLVSGIKILVKRLNSHDRKRYFLEMVNEMKFFRFQMWNCYQRPLWMWVTWTIDDDDDALRCSHTCHLQRYSQIRRLLSNRPFPKNHW